MILEVENTGGVKYEWNEVSELLKNMDQAENPSVLKYESLVGQFNNINI